MPPDTLKHQKGTRQLAPEREHATETTVAARVSHSTKAALKQLAEDRGTDSSKLVARLIRQELARAAEAEAAAEEEAEWQEAEAARAEAKAKALPTAAQVLRENEIALFTPPDRYDTDKEPCVHLQGHVEVVDGEWPQAVLLENGHVISLVEITEPQTLRDFASVCMAMAREMDRIKSRRG